MKFVFKMVENFVGKGEKRAMMALESLTWAFRIVWHSIKEQDSKSQPLGYKHWIFDDLT